VKLPIIGRDLTLTKTNSTIEAAAAIDQATAALTGKVSEKMVTDLGGFLEPISSRLTDSKSVSGKLLQANREWVYRNNDVIAQEVSKMNFELYQVGLSGGEIVYNEVFNHPLLDLLDKPNNEEVKSDALYIIQSHKKLAGDSFWLKLRTGKAVTSLRHLPPDKVHLVLRSPTADDPTVIEGYTYRDSLLTASN
jgi:hypothetical protein